MATVEKTTLTQAEFDHEEIIRLFNEGKPVTDLELIERIRGRSKAAREAVFQRNGLLDIAVPLIRDLRDGVEE